MNLLALLVDISMGVPVNPYPPVPSSPSLLLWNKSAWIQENGVNRCGTYYLLSSHLYAFLWWLYVLSQARRFQRRRFRVALSKFLIVWKRVFELFARLQTRDINGMSPNPFTWRWQFFLLAEKKTKRYFCPRMWAWIFRVKRCTVGMRNGMAQIGLEINSSGDVLLEKEKAPLLQWICWLK